MFGMDFWIVVGQLGVPVLMLALTLAVVSRSALGQAVIERLRRGSSGPDPAVVEDLAEEISRLSERLGELEERFDFAERILVERPEPRKLPPVESDAKDRVTTPV